MALKTLVCALREDSCGKYEERIRSGLSSIATANGLYVSARKTLVATQVSDTVQ